MWVAGIRRSSVSRLGWVWPVEAFHSPYVRHGIVALEANPLQKFPLYRSDEVVRGSGQVVRGNEWWRLSTVTGPVVVPINGENTRFRGDRSQTFVLEAQPR